VSVERGMEDGSSAETCSTVITVIKLYGVVLSERIHKFGSHSYVTHYLNITRYNFTERTPS